MRTALTLPAPEGFTGKLAEVARDYVAAARAEVEEALWAGEGGDAGARRFSDSVDRLVTFIFEVQRWSFERRYGRGVGQNCAVIAQGGYGRAEMNPWSDVDLLVLHAGRLSPFVQTINERLLLTLFDAGLHVGHAVRTVRDCLDQADRDVTVKTNLLDGRFVTGAQELGTSFATGVQDVLAARNAPAFVDAKMAEARERHERMGGSVFMLEPHVKEGQGGLRDIHRLVWIARVARKISRLEDLVAADVASRDECDRLLRARDFLLRVRSALHCLAAGKQDRLSFDAQEQVAERFGYPVGSPSAEPGARSPREMMAERFMRDYYSHAAVIARTTADLLDRLTAPPEPRGLLSRLSSRPTRDGVSVVSGQLVADPRIFERDPVNLVRIFADAQLNDVPLSAATQEAVRHSVGLLTPELARSPEAIEVFMGILRASYGVYRTLGELNRLGLLGRLIPEFGRLFCMVQHDHYHVYTVDEHSLVGVRELERLRRGELEDQSPLLTSVMRDHDRPEILFLGMMLHDLGKGYGGDHDERGAIMSRDVGRRLKLDVDDRIALEFLVRHHLLMSMLAQNRNIADPKLVAEFVRIVGTVENLRNLYLLTFADMRAVGPQVWSGWKNQLLGELYERAVEVFETGAFSERSLEARMRRARRRVLDLAEEEAEHERLSTFLDTMPAEYVASTTPDRVIEHWRLTESLGEDAFRCGVRHFVERGFSELTVCARDRPGLFVRITGVLSAHRLNVLSAKIETSTRAVALDTFRIDHAHDEHDLLAAEFWDRVRADIAAVLADRIDVGEMVAAAHRARRPSTSARRARQRAITRVSIDNEISDDYTVIDVYAADRPGLLFTLAEAIYRLGLTIHLAKINTRVVQVLDVFYVADQRGSKVTDPARHHAIEEVILASIRERDEREEAPAGAPPEVARRSSG
jgi:[protein-PII] uridylyltransferase